MLSAYAPGPKGLERLALAPGAAIPEEVIWLDLLNPTPEEERQVEQTGRPSVHPLAHGLSRPQLLHVAVGGVQQR